MPYMMFDLTCARRGTHSEGSRDTPIGEREDAAWKENTDDGAKHK